MKNVERINVFINVQKNRRLIFGMNNNKKLCKELQDTHVLLSPHMWTRKNNKLLVAKFRDLYRLCGLVRVLGYRFGGPGSIPGTTRKQK
jgi:hypothetical protein